MLGCALRGAYPVVPLADQHALSVGMVSVNEQACFGICADSEALPDVDALEPDVSRRCADLQTDLLRLHHPRVSLRVPVRQR